MSKNLLEAFESLNEKMSGEHQQCLNIIEGLDCINESIQNFALGIDSITNSLIETQISSGSAIDAIKNMKLGLINKIEEIEEQGGGGGGPTYIYVDELPAPEDIKPGKVYILREEGNENG